MAKKKLSELEVKIKKTGIVAKQYTDDKVTAAKLKKYEKGTANTGYLKTIILSTATTQQAAEADSSRIEIDIPKDLLLKSSKLLTVVVGTAFNPNIQGEIQITVIATGFEMKNEISDANKEIKLSASDFFANTFNTTAQPQQTIRRTSMPDVSSSFTNIEIPDFLKK